MHRKSANQSKNKTSGQVKTKKLSRKQQEVALAAEKEDKKKAAQRAYSAAHYEK